MVGCAKTMSRKAVYGSSARMASGMKDCPVDAAIVGIVDTVTVKD